MMASDALETTPDTAFDVPFDDDPVSTKTRAHAHRLAGSDVPIVIRGETGTGRRTLALATAKLRAARLNTNVTVIAGTVGVPAAVSHRPPVGHWPWVVFIESVVMSRVP